MDAGDPDDTGTVCGGGGNVMYKLLIDVYKRQVRACPRPWRLLTIPECAFWHFR